MEEIHNNKYRLTVIISVIAVLIFVIIAAVIIIGNSADAAPSKPTETTVVETISEQTQESIETTAATQETIHIETSEVPSEAPSAPVTPETDIVVGMTDRDMLACVVYQEVGGDASCDNCRRRVADIVLNRVADDRFPDTIEGVLTQNGQYGRFCWTGVTWPARATYSTERYAVERAYKVADEVLAGQHSEVYGNGYVWQAGFVQGSGGFWCCGHFFGK